MEYMVTGALIMIVSFCVGVWLHSRSTPTLREHRSNEDVLAPYRPIVRRDDG